MKPLTWRDLIPKGEALLHGRSYREAVDFGHTADWWRDVAVAMANEADAGMLDACKRAMHALTCEEEKDWRRSQSWPEAPYHFLFAAIAKAEGQKLREDHEHLEPKTP